MGQEQEPGPAGRTGDPRDEVRPLGHARVQLGGDAVVAEVVAEQPGRRGLVARRIDRVEADQLLEELDDLRA